MLFKKFSVFVATFLVLTLINSSSAATLNMAYGQIMKNLDTTFNMKYTPLSNGSSRYLGNISNKTMLLELIGIKKNIKQIYVMLFVKGDSQNISLQLKVLAHLFKNVFSKNTDKAFNWFSKSLSKINKGETKNISNIFDNKKITINSNKEFGMLGIKIT